MPVSGDGCQVRVWIATGVGRRPLSIGEVPPASRDP